MKVSVDFNCTPEEARRLMGLPDMSSVHELYLEQMRKAVSEGFSPDHFAEMVKNWGPMGDNALGMWKSMFDQMGGSKT